MRPYTVINVAMSADGKLSTRERRQVKISGQNDFARVDRLKAGCDAIMVGIGTVLADDPSLTVKNDDLKKQRRDQGKSEHPVRVVVDSSARIPLTASILNKGDGPRVVAVSARADKATCERLKAKSTVVVCGKTEVDLAELFDKLGKMGIRRIMVEGGGTLIAGLIRAGLADEIHTFVGNLIIGGKDAPTLADGPGWIKDEDFARLELAGMDRMDEGVLLHWTVNYP
ncbi:MAG: 2,5-diamino-6-(ribosylamino)-4(3H)-pyrimidinone 5'-phosphate reductase [Methanoregula sp.]|jgi:2,5-diamino-6-(ribosylamino)-4(3H)-pyrimidinone 5'-phosphate reductase